jgi:uncharacterized protein YcbX
MTSEPGPARVGRVAEIWRYPVKSMQGEPVARATFEQPSGLGDRRYGVVTGDGIGVLSAKREAALLLAKATSSPEGGAPRIELPDGTLIDQLGIEADAALSTWLGRAVHLRQADEQGGAAYRMSFNVDDEDDHVFEVPTPPSHYYDLAAVHLLTTASLAEAARLNPEGDWNPHRFRPTILVETEPELGGFVEDDWVGQVVTVGQAELDPFMTTVRCVMTTRPQPSHGLERDLDIYKSLGRHHEHKLGLYASVRAAGAVAVGDDVLVAAP